MLALVLPSGQLEASFVESERELLALGVPPERLALDAAAFRSRLRCGGVREAQYLHENVVRYRYWLPTTRE